MAGEFSGQDKSDAQQLEKTFFDAAKIKKLLNKFGDKDKKASITEINQIQAKINKQEWGVINEELNRKKTWGYTLISTLKEQNERKQISLWIEYCDKLIANAESRSARIKQ